MVKFDDITGKVKEVGNAKKTQHLIIVGDSCTRSGSLVHTLVIVFENLLFQQTFIICGSEAFRMARQGSRGRGGLLKGLVV